MCDLVLDLLFIFERKDNILLNIFTSAFVGCMNYSCMTFLISLDFTGVSEERRCGLEESNCLEEGK